MSLTFGEIPVDVINKYHHIKDDIHERYFNGRSTHVDRAQNIPLFRNWLFQLKPNGLDAEFKDEMDMVETLEPTGAVRQ
ncbi:hypothetical protein Ddye_028699 [Dipteronia dyeriana]|uniref:Uncharacterized protein n=1 Tax=Dipteronia dyeriana TaxID=168575 RepID=A0AAD9TD81_9ROSI|nr:hypothetical protein Ddye_028699 [Dipteronia dyeriana]